MKKVLVSGYIGFNNFGDEAIFYALSKHLMSHNYLVSVLSSNIDEVSKKYSVNAYYFKNIKQILNAIKNNDVLISGGGSLLQNNTSNFSLCYYLFIIFLAKIFQLKVVIFAQGIEKINGFFWEKLAKYVLKSVDLITVRDVKSQDYLKKLKLNSFLLSDPVYSLIQDSKPVCNKEGLIIQLRQSSYIDDGFLDNLSTFVAENYNGKISILSLQDDFDLDICSKFQNKLTQLNKTSEILRNNTLESVVEIINNAEYVISTRLHSAIVANALKTKTFTLNYDEKLKTLAEEFDLMSINLDNYTFEELNKKINLFFNSEFNFKSIRRFDWNILDNFLNEGNFND